MDAFYVGSSPGSESDSLPTVTKEKSSLEMNLGDDESSASSQDVRNSSDDGELEQKPRKSDERSASQADINFTPHDTAKYGRRLSKLVQQLAACLF
ncbi:hypothetical protein BaRGS_00036999 [Batillaria attramentaria]|uniref:Uncharacterized protein n=1 Tax=Batillaria attramentaria TaxID=370345 RepID=A0ABD0JAU6_9CAEN